METISLPPIAGPFIQSLRSVGYSIESAIADLVDNSVSAKATEVEIFTEWKNGNPILAIMDNGLGMTPDELQKAMQLGSISPIDERDKDDLGRFGMGLKTASFSQCKKLTVISRANSTDQWYGISWDLDLVEKENQWIAEVVSTKDCEQYLNYVNFKYSLGTVVIWNKIDRAIDLTAANSEKNFTSRIKNVVDHLALTFHRFIETDNVPRKVNLYINNQRIKARDPFAIHPEPDKQGSIILSEEPFKIADQQIGIKAFILPHPSNMSHIFAHKVSLNGDHYAGQGLYIYRAGRLIVSGGWYRLAKSSEANKLARIQLDFGNDADHLWHIDVKKSRVNLPESLRDQLRRVIQLCADKSSTTFTRRAKMASIDNHPVWQRIFDREKKRIFYTLNREHPILSNILTNIPNGQQRTALVSLIETALPVELIKNDLSAVNIRLERNNDDILIQGYELINKLISAGIDVDIIIKSLENDRNINLSREQLDNIIHKVRKDYDKDK